MVRSHWTIEIRLYGNMDVNFPADANPATTLIRIDLGFARGAENRIRQAAWYDSWTLRLFARIYEIEL